MKAILFVSFGLIAVSAQGQVTFTKDVAPILQEHCQVCHRPDTFAPMSLLTWEETRPWAKSIRQKVAAREMPPWYVDKSVGVRHFKNDASLSDQEIATIVKWVDAGSPKGDPKDMPKPASSLTRTSGTWARPISSLLCRRTRLCRRRGRTGGSTFWPTRA